MTINIGRLREMLKDTDTAYELLESQRLYNRHTLHKTER